MEEIRDEAADNGWPIFENVIEFSRGFPKLMRGDTNHSGKSEFVMRRFADEFFSRSELSQLGL